MSLLVDEIRNGLDGIPDMVRKDPFVFQFNTNDLPDVDNYSTNILEHEKFKPAFQQLNKFANNCLYWFSLKTSDDAQRVNQLLDDSRENLKKENRTVPPPNRNSDSEVLYLGIRRGGVRKYDGLTNISGRMVQHLGYYDKGSTQGLQLVHWAQDAEFQLSLNVVEFEELPNEYLNVVEKLMSYQLKPLCGRH